MPTGTISRVSSASEMKVGGHEAEARMVPPHQSFQADDGAVVQGQLWLVLEFELLGYERVTQISLQGQPPRSAPRLRL